MHHFFVSPEVLKSQDVVLGPAYAHRLGRVLWLRPGDRVVLLDNSGWQYEAQLTRLTPQRVEARLLGKGPATGEPGLRLYLYQALLRADKFDLVLQKGTELGITSFAAVLSLRSLALPPASARQARWQRIIQEAAEQSHRGRLPQLHPGLPLEMAVASAPGLRLLPWEGEPTTGLRHALGPSQGKAPLDLHQVSLLIGPEGGWDEKEVALARQQAQCLSAWGLASCAPRRRGWWPQPLSFTITAS